MNSLAKSVLAIALMVGVSAGATSMLRVDLPELTRASELVVRAKVKSQASRWTQDRLRIVTDVQLEVEESLKGSTSKRTITVQQPGGVVGDIGQLVHGLASFKEGDEVVVFLSHKGGEIYAVTGLGQGKYKVERSSDGKKAFAIPQTVDDAQLIDPKTQQPSASRRVPLDLEELKSQVKAVVALEAAQKAKSNGAQDKKGDR
jgi:hypothetical protein